MMSGGDAARSGSHTCRGSSAHVVAVVAAPVVVVDELGVAFGMELGAAGEAATRDAGGSLRSRLLRSRAGSVPPGTTPRHERLDTCSSATGTSDRSFAS